METVLSWMLIPNFWEAAPLILIEDHALKRSLGLSAGARRFSPQAVKQSKKLPLQLAELQSLRQRGGELEPYFKSLARLETRLILYEAVKRGHLLRIQPPLAAAAPKSGFPQEDGSQEDSPQEGGSQEGGSQESSSQKDGPQEDGPQEDGSQEDGSQGNIRQEAESQGGEPAAWLSVSGLRGGAQKQFQKAIRSYIHLISLLPGAEKAAPAGGPAGALGAVLPGAFRKKQPPPAALAPSLPAAEKKAKDSLKEGGGLRSLPSGSSLPAGKPSSGPAAAGSFEAGAPENAAEAGGQKAADFSERLARLQKDLDQFQAMAFAGSPGKHFQKRRIQAEIFYNSLKPFQKAWMLYLLFLFFALLAYLLKNPALIFRWRPPGLLPVFALGFLSHTLGLALRSYIMARPPVSNMFETVVWVPWAALLAGMAFLIKGARAPFLAAAILAFFCLFLTEAAPKALDSSLQPLEAVLRSSFWLSTHVLVITMSYSFFFLAFVLGDMALLSYIARKEGGMAFVRKMSAPIYRSLQWGVALLAAGTVLGAIWADYSWGRFWGWDPKESWALVSLLGYLALLHGRLAGWIRDMGMAVGAVLMFFLVIMAWYGVNFILGAGLHSYGFGTGGAGYVAGFLALHLILCGLALLRRRGAFWPPQGIFKGP